MFKILIIEDDDKMASIIRENLERWGYHGLRVTDFQNILEEYCKSKPDLILMDIVLPYYDGFYWCEKIRQVSKVPVIFISSRSSSMDIIMAVNMGGDDYITKPFSLDVLMVKISALIRRTYSYKMAEANVIEHNGTVLNLDQSTMTYSEQTIELTRNEYKILLILMRNLGKILSRDKIMRSLWEDESFVDDNTLTVNVNRLRKKLVDIGLDHFITTKNNQGYLII